MRPEEYLIDHACAVTQRICERSLWMLHPYLGLDHAVLEKIADTVEKVLSHTDELREHANGR